MSFCCTDCNEFEDFHGECACTRGRRHPTNDGAATARAIQAENSATLGRLLDLVNRCVEVTIFREDSDESGDPGPLTLIAVSPECQRRYTGPWLSDCLAQERGECEAEK